MSGVMLSDLVGLCSAHIYKNELGATPWHQQSWGLMRLPTETIGFFALTLTNLVIGSIYEIEVVSTGAQVAIGTASASSVTLNIPAYSGTSPLNALKVKVRKGTSSPFYQPYETQVTAVLGSASLFINQLSDE